MIIFYLTYLFHLISDLLLLEPRQMVIIEFDVGLWEHINQKIVSLSKPSLPHKKHE